MFLCLCVPWGGSEPFRRATLSDRLPQLNCKGNSPQSNTVITWNVRAFLVFFDSLKQSMYYSEGFKNFNTLNWCSGLLDCPIYCAIPECSHIDFYTNSTSQIELAPNQQRTNVRWFDKSEMYVTQQTSRGRYFGDDLSLSWQIVVEHNFDSGKVHWNFTVPLVSATPKRK